MAACLVNRYLPRTGPPPVHDGGDRGSAAPAADVGSEATNPSPRSSSAAVPPACPKQRSATASHGQQRSLAEVAELRRRWIASSLTVLPKLAVLGLATSSGRRQAIRARRATPAAAVCWHRSGRAAGFTGGPSSCNLLGTQRQFGLSNSTVTSPLALTVTCKVSWNLSVEPSLPVKMTVKVSVSLKVFWLLFSPNHVVK
jgi:hypothetical protein